MTAAVSLRSCSVLLSVTAAICCFTGCLRPPSELHRLQPALWLRIPADRWANILRRSGRANE